MTSYMFVFNNVEKILTYVENIIHFLPFLASDFDKSMSKNYFQNRKPRTRLIVSLYPTKFQLRNESFFFLKSFIQQLHALFLLSLKMLFWYSLTPKQKIHGLKWGLRPWNHYAFLDDAAFIKKFIAEACYPLQLLSHS